MYRVPPILLVVLFSCSALLRALTIDSYTAAANDRFADDAGFIANDYNLSGIAISSDGRWVTMISPNVFLTAWHYPPGNGQTVTFHQNNDPNGPSVTRTVSSATEQIGNSDLLLAVLDHPLPEGYTFYTRETALIPNSTTNFRHPYWLKEHFHFGRSPGTYATTLDVGVGKNVVDRYNPSQTISNSAATGPSIGVTLDSGASAVDYETYGIVGDSGAPLMLSSNGALKLVGITWYRATIGDPPVPHSNGFSPVGDYKSAIDAFLMEHSLPYQPLAPGLFTATRISDTQITLSWTDSSSVETAFELQRSSGTPDDWTPLSTLTANTTSYQDLTAPTGDVYYRLLAKNQTASEWSTASVLTPYTAWASDFEWGTADSSPTGDPNQDGLSNLAAYSMDVEPIDPVPAEALPYLETSTEYIDYFYRKNPLATDITFKLTTCTDLRTPNWQDILIDETEVTHSDEGPSGDARLMRIRMPASSVLSEGYFRLHFSSNQLP